MKTEKKIHINQNLAKILTEKCFVFFLFLQFFLWFFLNCPGGNSIWKSWDKSRIITLPTLDHSSIIISQIWKTWNIKIPCFITIFNLLKFSTRVKYLLSEISMFWKNRQLRFKYHQTYATFLQKHAKTWIKL